MEVQAARSNFSRISRAEANKLLKDSGWKPEWITDFWNKTRLRDSDFGLEYLMQKMGLWVTGFYK